MPAIPERVQAMIITKQKVQFSIKLSQLIAVSYKPFTAAFNKAKEKTNKRRKFNSQLPGTQYIIQELLQKSED